MTSGNIKKYFSPLNIVFGLEIMTVFLSCLSLIPRESALFLSGLIIFYLIFAPPKDSLLLLVMSIPLYIAMPLTQNFDSMANWRLFIAIFFLVMLKQKDFLASLKEKIFDLFGKNLTGLLGKVILFFSLVSLLSIFAANYKELTIKKIFFLGNIIALYFIISFFFRNKEYFVKILEAAAVSGIVVILGGLIQFVAVLVVPIYNFWQFWANKVILVFYGHSLADLLSYSNTWFAYYGNGKPPTLRIFSVFPDSHSFGLYLIFIIPVFLTLAFFYEREKRKKIFYWALTIISLFMIVISGSRGAWLSFVPIILLAIYIYYRKIERFLTKKALISLSLFILMFAVSFFYPLLTYKLQYKFSGGGESLFKRALSISDLSETSNKNRLQIWRSTAISIFNHPWLGVGFGNYLTVLNQDISSVKKGTSAHNLYLDVFAETGILGGLAVMLIFILIFMISWRIFRENNSQYLKFFGLLFGLYFLWAMAYSLFDVVLLNDKVFLLFVVELAAILSLFPKKENSCFKK